MEKLKLNKKIANNEVTFGIFVGLTAGIMIPLLLGISNSVMLITGLIVAFLTIIFGFRTPYLESKLVKQ